MSLSKSVLAQGKRLLMEAALKLHANTRSLNALSLRELAREAGLNDDLALLHRDAREARDEEVHLLRRERR